MMEEMKMEIWKLFCVFEIGVLFGVAVICLLQGDEYEEEQNE